MARERATALQAGGRHPDLGEHGRDLSLVLRRALVRGAAERQLGRGEAERVGRAALDDRDRLERFGGGAEEDDGLGIAGGRDDLAGRIDGDDDAVMDTLGDPAPGRLRDRYRHARNSFFSS